MANREATWHANGVQRTDSGVFPCNSMFVRRGLSLADPTISPSGPATDLAGNDWMTALAAADETLNGGISVGEARCRSAGAGG